jgi:YidC/Oxa1 family membrane protein insertase
LPDSFTHVWNLVLVWNIENALLWLTTVTGSAGIAIIVFTILVRTGMLPLSIKQIQSQKAMMTLQPKLKELQKRYEGDRAKLGQAQIQLYKEAGVNPLAGCLPMAIQMPIWFALYSALINLSHNEESFKSSFLWIHSLAAPAMPTFGDVSTWPLVILPVLTADTQWVVQKMSTMPTTDPQQQQMNRMMEFMPFMFLMFSFQVASGLTVYWVISNIYSIVQQRVFVGWGTLPYLGTKLEAQPAATQNALSKPTGPGEPQSSSSRRRTASSRKRRGK